jgi:disease resistance protein
MDQTEVPKLRCQRIGCDATFTEDNNPDGSCTYHDSVFQLFLIINFCFLFLQLIQFWVYDL